MKNNLSSFYAFLSRMKYITRWGLMRNTYSENLMEHSLQVSIIAHSLAIISNKYYNSNVDENKVAVIAMFHDCSEILTGDMPTPIKYYNKQLNQSYKEVELRANEKILSMLPKDFQLSYRNVIIPTKDSLEISLVKAADKLSAYIKCIEEEKCGNLEFKKAKQTILKSINNMKMPEVEYFLDNFIQAFMMSLDDLHELKQ